MSERHAPVRPARRRPPARAARPARTREPRPEQPPYDVAAAAALDAALDAAAATPTPELRSFGKLGLPDVALRALDRAGMHKPFAIQSSVLPDAIAGRDILARAATGSGKTLAFGLPTLARLHATPLPRGATADGRVRAVALVPTRELARQVADALTPLAVPLGLKVAVVYGGAPIHKQIEKLRRGVDLLVATPGRLVDLMNRGAAVLENVEVTVLDEADYLADLGFLPALSTILDATPQTGQRMLFSATLDRQIALLVERYLTDPAVHAIAETQSSTKHLMTHQMLVVAGHEKAAVATEIAGRPARTLFFTKTKAGADTLAESMRRAGVDAAAIHSDLKQSQRMKVLDAFTAGTTRVLVATDVAARGLHVSDVDLVVHYDPPHDHKDYLHRSGRTARAGASGTVVSIITHNQVRRTARLLEDASVTFERFAVAPGHAAVQALATSGEPIPPPPVPARPERTTRVERTHAKHGAGPRPQHGHADRPRRDERPVPHREDARPARRIEDTRPAVGHREDRRAEARRSETTRPTRAGAPKREPRPEVPAPRAEKPRSTERSTAVKKPRWTAADKAARRAAERKSNHRGSAPQNTAQGTGNRAARRAHLQPR
jgi:superfamily II DNA/RNA helicase